MQQIADQFHRRSPAGAIDDAVWLARPAAGYRWPLRRQRVHGSAAHSGNRNPHGAGAERSKVTAMIMRGALVQAMLGLITGVPIAWLCVRFVESQLYEVKGIDAVVLITSILTLIVAASLAGFVPARRAASIDPAKALRTE